MRATPRFFLLLILLLSGCCVVGTAQESNESHFESEAWRFFRGNDFDGHSADGPLANEWPEKGPPVLWHIDLGVGYSGFVGKDGKVYTQYQSLTAQLVVCLDARTGEKIWEHRYGWPYKPASLYPGPRSTPTIDGDHLYFATPKGSIGCLDLKTGDEVWFVDVIAKFKARPVEFGYACSPVCVGDKVIVPVGGSGSAMVALDKTDGSVVWNSGDHDISYCSAFPIEFQSRSLVVGYFKNDICVFDVETGKELCKRSISQNYDEHAAWPIYREPHMWISGPFRSGSMLFELRSKDGESIELKTVYNSKNMSNDVASSVLVEGQVYGFDIRDVQSKIHRPSRGQFTCMDFLTGELNWQNGSLGRRSLDGDTISSTGDVSKTDIGHASVIVADHKLILLNDTGQLILGAVSSDKFDEIGRVTILGGEIGWTGPSLMDRCVYARNNSKAVCVYLGEVAELTVDKTEVHFASEIEQSEYVDLAAVILGTEPKYAMTAPPAAWLVNWFLISLVTGWGAIPAFSLLVSRWITAISPRTLFLVFAFCVGIFGTTVAGRWQSTFYFSWPVALFIVFECVVCLLKSSDKSVKAHPVLARLSILWLIGVCVGYFWLCRRLSLAFEWTFLFGFPFALPFLWLVKNSVQREERYSWKQWLGSLLGFAAFYWVGAGVILWKYPIADVQLP